MCEKHNPLPARHLLYILNGAGGNPPLLRGTCSRGILPLERGTYSGGNPSLLSGTPGIPPFQRG